ncbi:unnamed protein product [Bursaphelenchus xylophilus]|uniref:(pine wood nematode) hypothetical protein n=1 Tax=Bursaphelenchus xylophilus TaxID=6326 RepID=A0A1I7RU95_BURXY|nr:unnamed protein product [Bursaphelenchus xylophilus]CAG9113950.1 unnamed protein product [Bursaphelenchus xylophilus]
MIRKFGTLFLLFLTTVSGNRPLDFLKLKAEFIETGINWEAKPCDDFWSFANGRRDIQQLKNLAVTFATQVLFTYNPKHNDTSLELIRNQFLECQSDPLSFFNALQRENPEQEDEIMEFGSKIQDEKAVSDSETFRGLLAEAYRLLFRYGSVEFKDLSNDLYATDELKFPFEFEHSDTQYQASVIDLLTSFNDSYVDEFLAEVFGEYFDLTQLEKVSLPLPNSTEIPLRKKLLYDLSVAAWKTMDTPIYKNCADFIMKTYPAYYVKMLLDYLGAEYVATVEKVFQSDAALLMKTVRNQFAFGNVLNENMTEFLERRVSNNTFYGLQTPALLDPTFFTIFGQVATEWPVQNKWINNLQPLIPAAYGKDTTYFWIPGLDDNALHIPETQRTFVNVENLKHPLFHPWFPPVLRWSVASSVLGHEFGHDFGTDLAQMTQLDSAYEQIFDCLDGFYAGQCDPLDPGFCADPKNNLEENFADVFGIQMTYLAYKQDTAINGAGRRLQGNFVEKLTDDQLFFVNFAQSIATFALWGEVPLEDPHAPGSLRLWGPLAGFPAFANAFNCPAGSRFNQPNGCKLYTDNIAPSHNLTDGV